MTVESFLDVIQSGIYTLLFSITPVLALSLGVGLLIGIFQAVTQINEQTLSFVPKIFVVFISLVVFGGWILNKMMDYLVEIFSYYMNLV
ncbi:MAG TPA: flagellar biosynthesis protein FliQ [Thermotogota bacterium]|nr:flagellar biosynthesis protein FliQ [Thermotogota bacterium]HRW93150.1 flagellar biosynthesis protein FliQ [Thermotogota bacterium]